MNSYLCKNCYVIIWQMVFKIMGRCFINEITTVGKLSSAIFVVADTVFDRISRGHCSEIGNTGFVSLGILTIESACHADHGCLIIWVIMSYPLLTVDDVARA